MPPEPFAARPPFHVDGCLFCRENIFISHSKVIIRGLETSFGSQDDPENERHVMAPVSSAPVSSLFQVIAALPKHHLQRTDFTRPLAGRFLPSQSSQARAGTQTGQDTSPPPAPCCVTLSAEACFCTDNVQLRRGPPPGPQLGADSRESLAPGSLSTWGPGRRPRRGGVFFIEQVLLVVENLRASYWDLVMTVIAQRRGLGL